MQAHVPGRSDRGYSLTCVPTGRTHTGASTRRPSAGIHGTRLTCVVRQSPRVQEKHTSGVPREHQGGQAHVHAAGAQPTHTLTSRVCTAGGPEERSSHTRTCHTERAPGAQGGTCLHSREGPKTPARCWAQCRTPTQNPHPSRPLGHPRQAAGPRLKTWLRLPDPRALLPGTPSHPHSPARAGLQGQEALSPVQVASAKVQTQSWADTPTETCLCRRTPRPPANNLRAR